MKKLMVMLLLTLLLFSLSACKKDIIITSDIIDVQFENVRWEDDKIVTDIYITNGTEISQYIDYMDFALFLPDGNTEFCGAQFDILTSIKPNDYVSFEIEFTKEYVFMTKTQLEELNISLDQLELTFWIS